jgi:two-component sensor histidine kinase
VQLFPRKGLANILFEKIEIDAQGNYWVQTNNGFYKVSADFKKWINFSGNSGINGMAGILEIYRAKDNQFIITSSGRILHFKPDAVTVNSQSIPVIIASIKTRDTTYYFPTTQNTTVNISYTSSIEAELSALGFCNEKENRIYYKLQGWDNDWKELLNSSRIRYEQLPSGNYTLYAKAVNNAGVESKEIASLKFYVQPPLWKTWWFISICLIVFICAIYLLYRYKLNQIVKEERLRSKIATDLHDDIGSTLSSISFYTETIKQQTAEKIPNLTPLLNKMGESSREMVGNMSDIVWAINPVNDDVKHLATRIQIHAATLCSLKNIVLHFQCDEAIYSLKLNMEQRQNIFLMFKEGINNALKYANCTEITICLSKQNSLFTLLLKDNGKGFIIEEADDGNGLLNMQKRANDIGGNFSITSTSNVGTTIAFSCNIT